ncbi:MAG: hypothetical protein BIFFINMI_00305 [Phycisphaerae bacterium]|nr:hypothetical protein [Phycisphaerae bacterium]
MAVHGGGTAEADGIHAMAPRERMSEGARKLRDAYNLVPDAPLYRREFGFYCMERWHEQGLACDANIAELFSYDPPGNHALWGLGWCESAFSPAYEIGVIEDRGNHELIRDVAGRSVLVFKGRRSGFMPEYVDHPVKDMRTWREDVKWRLDPATPARWADMDKRMADARAAAGAGLIVSQRVIGGYMFLRSLIGPEQLFYAFYDMPEVIEECMQAWLALADAVIARHQRHVTIDEIFLAEDICYNHGPLCSPEMMRRFLLPYYQQLITNLRGRQIDRGRKLFVQVDTDGFADPVIPVYRESIELNGMSPFEVAAGCDVLRTGREHPDMVILGGIDKRVLATTRAKIDRMVERILPAMRARGGYVPTCDHGVPEEVTLENYLHYRKRCVELGG